MQDVVRRVLGSLCLTVTIVLIHTSLTNAQSPSTSNDGECITYQTELKSRPDLTHRIVYATSPLPPGYIIADMTLDASRQRSFYWCELKLPEGDQMKIFRHFGHNTTHLWVEKGCGAWFTIIACHKLDVNNTVADVPTTRVQMTTMTTPGTPRPTRKELQLSDLNQGSLLSLITWLNDKGQSLEEKLGGGFNTRVARSVDEEFELEFGPAATRN